VLSNARLQEANLSRADLSEASFDSADASKVKIDGATIVSTEFHNANLSNVTFDKNTDARNAKLRGANLTESDLSNVRLFDADMRGATLDNADISGALLSGTQLQGASLSFANLIGAALVGAKLDGADLSDARMTGARMASASLRFANLANTELTGADLSEADLRGAILENARLELANLSKTKLQAAKLEQTRLQAAIFTGSSMTLADFSGVSVWRTSGVDCTGSFVADPDYSAEIVLADESEEVFKGPKGILQFIRNAVGDLDGEDAKTLDRTLRERARESERNASNPKTGERAWRACQSASAGREAYESKLAPYLIELACGALDNAGYRKFLQHWVTGPYKEHQEDRAFVKLLARKILDLDLAQCTPWSEISDEASTVLRAITLGAELPDEKSE
jgi:uncharacterized protein YjbI with pentapeptide repeats